MRYPLYIGRKTIFAVTALFLLSGCIAKYNQSDGYFPKPVLKNQTFPLIYLNAPEKQKLTFDALSYINVDGSMGKYSADQSYSNYSKNSLTGAIEQVDLPDVVQVIPISKLFYVQYVNYALIQDQKEFKVIEYSTFDPQDLQKYQFGKPLNNTLLKNSFKKTTDCPLYGYDPTLFENIRKCDDALYIFLYPMLIKTNRENTNITHTADVVIKSNHQLYPMRLVYRYDQVNNKQLAQEFIHSEMYFAIHLLNFLKHESSLK